MLRRNQILCAMVGGVMIALPVRARAADHHEPGMEIHQHAARIEIPARAPSVQLADDDDDEYHEHHHGHGWYKHHHDDDDDDYNWGGRHRYQYPPSYFGAPPPASYNPTQRYEWLQQRRRNALYMKGVMERQGDYAAASRLQNEIDSLNTQLRIANHRGAGAGAGWNPNDYNWGGRYRYQYPPSYFSAPPPNGYGSTQRYDWLQQRRRNAEYMKQKMVAQGDTKAADRLQGSIDELNRQLRQMNH